jgi:ion channel
LEDALGIRIHTLDGVHARAERLKESLPILSIRYSPKMLRAELPVQREFFYFSVVTIATLGYGDITPASGIARALVSTEVALGVGWITIVFAAVMSHLQPRFAEIAKQQHRGRVEPGMGTGQSKGALK